MSSLPLILLSACAIYLFVLSCESKAPMSPKACAKALRTAAKNLRKSDDEKATDCITYYFPNYTYPSPTNVTYYWYPYYWYYPYYYPYYWGWWYWG